MNMYSPLILSISKVRNNNEPVLFNRINHCQENEAKIKLTNFASLFTFKSRHICNLYWKIQVFGVY
jgi:hypothetical protein